MFCVFTEVGLKIIQLLLNKTSSYFQVLHVPMCKVDQSSLCIYEVPPLQLPKKLIKYTS